MSCEELNMRRQEMIVILAKDMRIFLKESEDTFKPNGLFRDTNDLFVLNFNKPRGRLLIRVGMEKFRLNQGEN